MHRVRKISLLGCSHGFINIVNQPDRAVTSCHSAQMITDKVNRYLFHDRLLKMRDQNESKAPIIHLGTDISRVPIEVVSINSYFGILLSPSPRPEDFTCAAHAGTSVRILGVYRIPHAVGFDHIATACYQSCQSD